MDNIKNYTDTELLHSINDAMKNHEEKKEEINNLLFEIENIDKKINNCLSELDLIESIYVKLIEEYSNRK